MRTTNLRIIIIIKDAIKIICSDDSPAQPSREALMKMKDKHPSASGGLDDLPCIDADMDMLITIPYSVGCEYHTVFVAFVSTGSSRT